MTDQSKLINAILPLLIDHSTMDVDRLAWPIVENTFGIPVSSLTLDGPVNAGGLYLIDIQKSYPDVDWQTLDRLYIPAGEYRFIRIGNLPDRSDNNPLIITNKGGQVLVGGQGHHYAMEITGGTNWVLTGRYDSLSLTGDVSYVGHRGGVFANTQGQYGFLVDDDFGNAGSGIRASYATKFQIEYIEIREVYFAGMLLKRSGASTADMEGVSINDNYIHDTGSEGLYIGATEGPVQHRIKDWQIYNNRILRTGTEALQLQQLSGTTLVHHNVIGPAALDWRAAFQNFQDNNLQIGLREGHLDVYNNVFIGSAGAMISFFSEAVDGDPIVDNVGATFRDNYFHSMRGLGMYMNNVGLENMTYVFERNSFGGWRFEYDEVYNTTENDHLFRIVNATTPVVINDNIWNGPAKLHTSLPSGNGTSTNKTGQGNVNAEPESIRFVNSGFSHGFDYRNLEMWAAVASLGVGAHADEPVIYQLDDIVVHLALPYRCIQNPCAAGLTPENNPNTWLPLAQFADDVRVIPGSTWESLGLQPGL